MSTITEPTIASATATVALSTSSHYAGLWAGWRWIVGGYALFSKARAAWIGLTLCFIILAAMLSALMSMIPVVGAYAAGLLAPVFSAGVMLGCRDLSEGRPLRVGRLTGGFNEGRMVQLLGVGAVWCLGSWIISTFVFAQVASLWIENLNPQALMLAGFSMEALWAVLPGLTLALAVALALYLPLAMAVWFAPALVQLSGVSAPRAVGLSFMGCLRNSLPFLIYALLLLLVLLGIGLLFFAVTALLAKGSALLGILGTVVYFLSLLALVAVYWASSYVGYTEIFGAEVSAAVAPSAHDSAMPKLPMSRQRKVSIAFLMLALPAMCVGRVSLSSSTGQAFFDAVAAQDYAAAEARVSPELVEMVNSDGYGLPGLLTWMGIADVESAEWSGSSFGGDEDEELKMEVVTRTGERIPVELGFAWAGGGWKINSIQRSNFTPTTPQPQRVSPSESAPADTAESAADAAPGATPATEQNDSEKPDVAAFSNPESVASAKPIGWADNAVELRGRNDERTKFVCPVGGTGGAVYGTGLYTDDSSICTAAVHAGLISFERGGTVQIQIEPGASAYQSTAQHGVTSRDYGAWTGSYRFVE